MASNANKKLSQLAQALLLDMAARPNLLQYNTRILGGHISRTGIEQLDAAYTELHDCRYIEPTGSVVMFFGGPKRVYRITELGCEAAKGLAA